MAKSEDGYAGLFAFRVLEVHTLHIRDFGGERRVQALGEFGNYEISAARAQSELRAALYPMRRILTRCVPFLIVLIVGAALCLALTPRDTMFAFRALGPVALFCGIAGMVSEALKVLTERRLIEGMEHDKALEHAAWRCFLADAPKKYEDNDITYIPIDEDTLGLNEKELGLKYDLLPAISRRAVEVIHHKQNG